MRRSGSPSRSLCLMCIWYGCHLMSSVVIRLKVDLEICARGLRRAVMSGSCCSASLTTCMLTAVLAVLWWPDASAFLFWLFPKFKYLSTFLCTVHFYGTRCCGNLLANASRVCCVLPHLKYLTTIKTRSSSENCSIFAEYQTNNIHLQTAILTLHSFRTQFWRW